MKTAWVGLVGGALALFGAGGCTTSAFCFTDCEGSGQGSGDGGPVEGGQADGPGHVDANPGDACIGLFCNPEDGSTDTGDCTPTGDEICDGKDNDCNGKVDDGIDYGKPRNCGDCATDCTLTLEHVAIPVCNAPDPADGTTPGTCDYQSCATDYYDVDGNRQNGCEYYCPFNPTGANTTDPGGVDGCGQDDDCDGEIDEDVGTCDDVDNCGRCGKKCFIQNGTASCVTTAAPTEACTEANTHCEVAQCDIGFEDVDGSADNGCEYQCPVFPTTDEICDGLDNDCDGRIDNADADLPTTDPDVGNACFGGTAGECIDSSHEGVEKCIGGAVQCCDKDSGDTGAGLLNGECSGTVPPFVLHPGDLSETCNGKDDDCNGVDDDNPIDAGGVCGSSVGNCQTGTQQCVGGSLDCVGAVGPQPDLCNAQDDDCDGVIDGTIPPGGTPTGCNDDGDCGSGEVCRPRTGPTDEVCVTPPGDASGACDVPPPPPSGATQPCRAGTFVCVGGLAVCQGSVTASSAVDLCGDDTNCDGALTDQPDLSNDVRNCGACGNDCNALSPGGHGQWACQDVGGTPTCVRTGCEFGFIDCDGNADDCERSCTFTSSTEVCNGVDDNCDCRIDETTGPSAIPVPSPQQVCDVNQGATDCGCREEGASGCGAGTGIQIQCASGAWRCTFPSGYCTGTAPDYCTGGPDPCDGIDNNCNGNADESFKPPVIVQNALGQPCKSSGSGACVTSGVYVCNSAGTATECNANPVSCSSLPGGCAERCDGLDNDCDGSIDEPFTAKGSNATYYVSPAVTNIGGGTWIYQYEASRPDATSTTPGSGNGWQTSAPAGETIDGTQSCSVAGAVPWFNVLPPEAAQVCQARGGRLCDTADWVAACEASVGCDRGYNPRGAGGGSACNTNRTGLKFCNIGPFDFDTTQAGIQDGLLPTASGVLQNCWADWSGLNGNPAANDDVRDIMGNLREITFNDPLSPGGCNEDDPNNTNCVYTLMGGAFNTQDEDGAACDFQFFNVDASFRLFDVGFRCCFDGDPR